MIDSISIATFISHKEQFNLQIVELYRFLKERCRFAELIVFADKEPTDADSVGKLRLEQELVVEVCPNTTKYRRILRAIELARTDRILFVDNDISPDMAALYQFLQGCDEEADLAFGRIGGSSVHTLTERLVQVDKSISHKIIRPFLWACDIGISVPGQVFVINKLKFGKDLADVDTVFDDLFLGICAKSHGYTVQRSKLTLGYEQPSANFLTLCRQRLRWAKGFAQSLWFHRKNQCFPLVVIHGLAYHASLILLDAILLLMAVIVPYALIPLVLWLLLGLFMCDFRLRELPFSLLYTVIFPVLHLVWFCALTKHLILLVSAKEQL